MDYTEISHCRSCNNFDIIPLFSLGEQFLTDFVPPGTEKNGISCPLELVMCDNCKFVQLKHTIDQNKIYGRPVYWYKSGINNSMKSALQDVVEKAQLIAPLKDSDTIIDIGSNDGTLASFYPPSVKKIGFEPSENVWHESFKNVNWTKTFNDYFSYKGEVAKIITSCAMFYDLEDPKRFVRDIHASLSKNGIWVDQQNYLGFMIQNNTFDNISHEHLGYYSFKSFKHLIERYDLEIIDVETNNVNGGSFRTYIKRKSSVIEAPAGAVERIAEIERQEEEMKLFDVETFQNFYNQAQRIREQIVQLITSEKKLGKKIWVYGASTRGQVILQFMGLDKTLITAAAERNPDKYGLVTIGTGIPITSEKIMRDAQPDYLLVLPYSFKTEFIEREAEYLKKGGKLIFPLPQLEIAGYHDSFRLALV